MIVTQQRLNITKITFKNLPLKVLDEEIIHLWMAYGKPVDNKVRYEVLRNPKNTPDLLDSWTWSWSCMRASPSTTITGWKVLFLETMADMYSSSTLVKPSRGWLSGFLHAGSKDLPFLPINRWRCSKLKHFGNGCSHKITDRTAFRQRCCPNPIQSIIPPPGICWIKLFYSNVFHR